MLAQHTHSHTHNIKLLQTGEYIASSYVKFVESAGARVVPIFYNSTTAELDTIFAAINGILFPGGGTSIANDTVIHQTANYLYNLTIASNDANNYFPLWGTCLGMEMIAILTAANDAVLCAGCFSAENISLPLEFTELYAHSRMFSETTPELLVSLANNNLTSNEHTSGVTVDEFQRNYALANFYNVLSVNRDQNGLEFVSTMEAVNYPIYAVQWHPEKVLKIFTQSSQKNKIEPITLLNGGRTTLNGTPNIISTTHATLCLCPNPWQTSLCLKRERVLTGVTGHFYHLNLQKRKKKTFHTHSLSRTH